MKKELLKTQWSSPRILQKMAIRKTYSSTVTGSDGAPTAPKKAS